MKSYRFRVRCLVVLLLLAAVPAYSQEPADGPNRVFRDAFMDGGADPPTYEALVYIGYQHADQRYVVHWLDVYGGKFSAIGYGRGVGDTIPFYNTFKWDARSESWTLTMEATGKDGKRELFAVDTLRRN